MVNDFEIWMWLLFLSINHPVMHDHSQQKEKKKMTSLAPHQLDSEEWPDCMAISVRVQVSACYEQLGKKCKVNTKCCSLKTD